MGRVSRWSVFCCTRVRLRLSEIALISLPVSIVEMMGFPWMCTSISRRFPFGFLCTEAVSVGGVGRADVAGVKRIRCFLVRFCEM